MRKTFLFIFALCAVTMAWGETTVTKTVDQLATMHGWANAKAYQSFTLDDVISVVAKTSSDKTCTYPNGYYTSSKWYMYQGDSNGEFTISAAAGYIIKTIKITYSPQNSGILSFKSGFGIAEADQIASGSSVTVDKRSATLYVGCTAASSSSNNINARITQFTVTYELVEQSLIEEFRDPVGDTLWNHNTAATTKLGTYGEWEMEGIRHTNPSDAMDKLQTNSTPGVGIGWKDNPHMQTTAEGGVKALSFLWNQGATAKETDKTEKITVTVGDQTQDDTFTGTPTTSRPGDRMFLFSPEVKSNATLRLEGVNGNRIVVGPITIVPYLRYTYTEAQQVNDDESTFDCSLQINNTDGEGAITYSSSNTDVVSFADPANPEATIVGGGEATITATWSEASTSFKLKVNVLPVPTVTFPGITDSKKSVALNVESFTEAATVDMEVPIVYSSSNENVATVNEDGKVTVLTTGTTEITAKVEAEKGEYKEASATYTLTVTASEASEVSFVEKYGEAGTWDNYSNDKKFIGTDNIFYWVANNTRRKSDDKIGSNVGLRFGGSLEGSYHFQSDPEYNDGIMEGGIKRIAFTYKEANNGSGVNFEISANSTKRTIKTEPNSGKELPFAANFFVKENTSLKMYNTKGASVVTIGPISIVPYLLFTTKSDEAFLSSVEEYDIKNVLINNTDDDGTVAYFILTADAQSQISNEGVVTFDEVTESETITIQAAWTPAGESSATVTTTMTLYVDVESKTDKTVDEKFSKYDTEGWTNSEGSEVTKNGDVYNWRTKLTRHKTDDKLVDNKQAIWFAQGGYVATADATDNTKVGPAEGGIKRIAFDWNQNGANQTGDDLYISVSVDGTEMSAIRRDGGEQPEQPWQYIHNLNVKKNATLKIENKSTTSKSEGGRVKIGTIVITPYLLYTTKEVSKMFNEGSYINADLVNNIDKDLDGGTITFTSSDEEVATIVTDDTHKDKVVFGAAGDVTISANWTPDGAEEPAITTSYLLHITEKDDRGLYFQYAVKGTTVGVSVTNTLNGTFDGTTQTWSTASENAITSVDNEGLVSPVAIGTDTVTVVVAGSDAYQEGTASYKVIVRTGVDDNNKLVESFSGIDKDASTSEKEWKGDLKDYFSWKVKSTRHNGAVGDTIGGAGVAGTVLFAQGQIATDDVIEGGIKYFTFNWKQPYVEQGATLRLTLNAGDKAYQQDYVVATDNGSTTHEHLYFAGDMQVKKNVQLTLKNESFKTESSDPLTSYGRIAIDKFEIVPYLFYKTKSHKIDVVKGDAPTWTNTDLINNTDGGTIVYSIEDIDGEGVAEIDADNGLVTAQSNGKAKVTATWTPADALEGEVVTATYTLEVFAERLDAELTFDPEEITVGVNETTVTTPTLGNPHELTVKYSSYDENIATVDENSGAVTLKGVAGDVTIFAKSAETGTYKEGSAFYTIHVLPLPTVTFPELTDKYNIETVDMDHVPFTESISVKVNGEEVPEPTITYESSNENAARVNEMTGEVTIISVGTTVITATVTPTETYAGTTASYTLKVKKENIGDAWVEGFGVIEQKSNYIEQDMSVRGDSLNENDRSVYTWKIENYQRNTETADKVGEDLGIRLRARDKDKKMHDNHIMFDGVQEGGIKAIAFDWRLPGSGTASSVQYDVIVNGETTHFDYKNVEAGYGEGNNKYPYAQFFGVRKNTTLTISIPQNEVNQAVIFGPITIVPYLLFTQKTAEVDALERNSYTYPADKLINNTGSEGAITYSMTSNTGAAINANTGDVDLTSVTVAGDETITATWGEVSTTYTLKVTKAEDPEPEPDFVRDDLHEGQLITVCWENEIATVEGGTFYEILSGDISKIIFQEMTLPIAAGTPVVFESNGDDMKVFYGEGIYEGRKDKTISSDAFVGLVRNATIDNVEIEQGNILINNGQLRQVGEYCVLTKGHAYIKTSALSSVNNAPRMGAHRITLYNPDAAPTNFNGLNGTVKPMKVLRDGQFYIIRETKTYNAQGILVE